MSGEQGDHKVKFTTFSPSVQGLYGILSRCTTAKILLQEYKVFPHLLVASKMAAASDPHLS